MRKLQSFNPLASFLDISWLSISCAPTQCASKKVPGIAGLKGGINEKPTRPRLRAQLAAAALASAKSLLQEWPPGGRFEGHEYVALNPTRNDRSPGSFKINWQTGKWSDFANPNAKGGDLISLFAYINSLDQGKAPQQIADKLGMPARHGAALPTRRRR